MILLIYHYQSYLLYPENTIVLWLHAIVVAIAQRWAISEFFKGSRFHRLKIDRNFPDLSTNYMHPILHLKYA